MTHYSEGDHEADYPAQAILHLLLGRHPAVVAFDELVRELAHAPEHHGVAESVIRDGVSDLVGDGLAHRLDGFVLASRAAVRASVLIG
jgi:hypothetical protein